MVEQAKSHRGETIIGDFSTLTSPCPKCGGVMQETYKKFQCRRCDFALWKILAGRQFETAEMEQLIIKREVGPLQGFRSKTGRLFNANVKLNDMLEMKFDFGKDHEAGAEEVDFSGQAAIGKCPRCGGNVYEHGMSYICERAVGAARDCSFRTGKIILARALEREQVAKLLHTGKTDLLSKFISKKGRPFSAYLVMGKDGKVEFEFEAKETKETRETKARSGTTQAGVPKARPKSSGRKSAAQKT
jgi:DNA topoisomerase-3